MGRNNFERCYSVIRRYEGGNVNNPKDPGGRTSRGITQRVYDSYRITRKLKVQSVYNASEREVKEIYKSQYWNEIYGDELKSGLDLCMFDTAVNSGATRATKIMQAALRASGAMYVRIDGDLGMSTRRAMDEDQDNDKLVEKFGQSRMGFLRQLRTWPTFGDGWRVRVNNSVKIAQAWASGSVGPPPVDAHVTASGVRTDATGAPQQLMSAKATDDLIVGGRVTPGGGAAVTATGVGGTGIMETLRDQTSILEPLGYYSDYILYIVIALTVLGVAMSMYGAWRSYKNSRALAGEETAPMDNVNYAATSVDM